MKKQLGKKEQRTAKTLQLYANFCAACNCGCSCGGCASVPSTDYMNVKNSAYNRVFGDISYYSVQRTN